MPSNNESNQTKKNDTEDQDQNISEAPVKKEDIDESQSKRKTNEDNEESSEKQKIIHENEIVQDDNNQTVP
ncbi:unnamed protein product [Rotaria sordida]|uniref:Uncharacterized protein n=2 Tax=Rotaria sordida TaxID=392033 RepID=A0A820JTF3_9BILA|nr:unnamed protein product [Rotaria sordida]